MKTPKVKIRADNYHLFIVMIASLLRKRIRSFFIVILRRLLRMIQCPFYIDTKRNVIARYEAISTYTGH